MHNTNEINHCIKGNVLFTEPHNATKKSHLLVPQLVQESQGHKVFYTTLNPMYKKYFKAFLRTAT
jgi:hypothetical protein